MSATSSELFRRGIVLPLNIEALAAMRVDVIEKEEPYSVVSFSTDEQFYRIWKTGLFAKINETCNTIIDDYEFEVLPDAGRIVPIIRDILQDFHLTKEDRSVLNAIMKLGAGAERLGFPLFFVF